MKQNGYLIVEQIINELSPQLLKRAALSAKEKGRYALKKAKEVAGPGFKGKLGSEEWLKRLRQRRKFQGASQHYRGKKEIGYWSPHTGKRLY